jgi:hypothetical protein
VSENTAQKTSGHKRNETNRQFRTLLRKYLVKRGIKQIGSSEHCAMRNFVIWMGHPPLLK